MLKKGRGKKKWEKTAEKVPSGLFTRVRSLGYSETTEISFFHFGCVPIAPKGIIDELKLQMFRLFAVPKNDPNSKCCYCNKIFSSKVELITHMLSQKDCRQSIKMESGKFPSQIYLAAIHCVDEATVGLLKILKKTPRFKGEPMDIITVQAIPFPNGPNVRRHNSELIVSEKPKEKQHINAIGQRSLWTLAGCKSKWGKANDFSSHNDRDAVPFLMSLPFIKPFDQWPRDFQEYCIKLAKKTGQFAAKKKSTTKT
jgi:hypothetical protein